MIAGAGRPRLAISGAAYHVPDRVVTNDDLARMMNTSADFIVQRTGVVRRRHARPEQSLNDLILPAARAALERADRSAQELDAIIVSTLSPDYHDPSQACLVQAALGTRCVPSFDIRAQCSGMLYGMELASALIQSGRYARVLLVCAEMLSKRIDPSDAGRNLAILLGDGAGALVLEASQSDDRGLIDLRLGADGNHFHLLHTAAPGSLHPTFMSESLVRAQKHQFRMNGAAMFEHATETLINTARDMLDAHGMSVDDVDLFVPHQPNLRILEAVFGRLGVPEGRWVRVVEELGNIASASLPIALACAAERGQLTSGQTIALLAYGAGATWGVGLYRT